MWHGSQLVWRCMQMGFRGSYSALWSPASFWEPETPLHGRKLRLYMLPSSAQVCRADKTCAGFTGE